MLRPRCPVSASSWRRSLVVTRQQQQQRRTSAAPAFEEVVRPDGSVVRRMRRPGVNAPHSLRPVDVPPDYVPFPLPQRTEDTGYAPLRHSGVPDIELAEARRAQATNTGGEMKPSSSAFARAGWREPSATDAGDVDGGTLEAALGSADDTQRAAIAMEAQREAPLMQHRAAAQQQQRRGVQVAEAPMPAGGSHSAEDAAALAEWQATFASTDVRAIGFKEVPMQRNRHSVSGVPAPSPRHLQYDREPGSPQIERLRSRRTLDDLLHQYRTTTYSHATAPHVAALADVVHSLDRLTEAEAVEFLDAVRDTLTPGPAALYFPLALKIGPAATTDPDDLRLDLTRLHAYLQMFDALEARFCTPGCAAGLALAEGSVEAVDESIRGDVTVTALEAEPAFALGVLQTMAHAQILNTKGPFGIETRDFETGGDSLSAGLPQNVRTERWPGWRVQHALVDTLVLRGADVVFAGWTLPMLAEGLAAYVGMYASLPSQTPASEVVDAFVERISALSQQHVSSGVDDAVADAAICTAAAVAASTPRFDEALMRSALRVKHPTAEVAEAAAAFRPRIPFAELSHTLERLPEREANGLPVIAALARYLRRSANLSLAGAAKAKNPMPDRTEPRTSVGEEHAPESTTPLAIEAARSLRISDRLLHLLALTHPWKAEHVRVEDAEERRRDGWEDVRAGRVQDAINFQGSTEAATSDIINADADVLQNVLPSPEDADVEFLNIANVRRFGDEMASPETGRYVEAILFHPLLHERGTPPLVAALNDAIELGRRLVIVNFATLMELYETEMEAPTLEARRAAAAIIQLLLHELHCGRAVFVPLADELEMQCVRGSTSATYVLWDTIARVIQRLILVRPRVLLGAFSNPLMQIDGRLNDFHALDGNSDIMLSQLVKLRNEAFKTARDGSIRFDGGTTARLSSRAGWSGGTRDPSGARFDFRVSTSRRIEKWSVQPSRSGYDKAFREPGGVHALPGRPRGLEGHDMHYLGIHTPSNTPR